MTKGWMIRLTALGLTTALALVGVAGTLGLGAGSTPVRAASPIYVRTDGNDTACDGTVNAPYSPGTAPNCALATIQHGVLLVDTGGTVYVGTGTYTETFYINRGLTVQGAGASSTIVDGADSDRKIVEVNGGIAVTISDVTIRDSSGEPGGGGIINFGALTLTNSIVSDNITTDDADGAGIANFGETLLISNSVVVGNTADRDGGGVLNLGDLTIINSDIVSNTGKSGAGIYHIGSRLTILNTTIRDNVAFGHSAYGGGVFNDGSASLSRVTLSGNTAVYTDAAGGRVGGGIHNQDAMTLTNCTISGNMADWGGGISNSGDWLAIASSTIARNRATSVSAGPGGISNYGAVTVTNTMIAQNDNANCFNEGTFHSGGHNLDSADTCGFGASGDLTETDPRLGPLADNGGLPTRSGQVPWTHALRGGSPAIDAGATTVCPIIDQRGVARPVDGNLNDTAECDIGAYEFEPAQLYLPLTTRAF